jgi:hypothetical protein
MGADLFDRREILHHAGAAFQDTTFGRKRRARDSIFVSGNMLMTGHGCTIQLQLQSLSSGKYNHKNEDCCPNLIAARIIAPGLYSIENKSFL